MKKKLLSLLVLLAAATTGAWAEDCLYLKVNGTKATLMYDGNKGTDDPYCQNGNWTSVKGSYSYKTNVDTLTVDQSCRNFNGTNLGSLFLDFNGLKAVVDFGNFNTSNVTNMGNMFQNCKKLETLDLSGWNTEKVESLSAMFLYCEKLQTVNVSGWNTSNVTDMGSMFQSCSSLQSIDLRSWNTSKVTQIYNMFLFCSKLEAIYVGAGWSTVAVTNGSGMFAGCSSLPGYDSYSPNYDKAYAGEGGLLSNYILTAEDSEKGTIAFFRDGKKTLGANEGNVVTLTVSPEEGYGIGSVTADAYTNWESAGTRRRVAPTIPMLGNITLTPVEGVDTAWTFTMPPASVLASCEYTPIAVIATAPEAVDSIVAGENKAIISAGTVANIPQSSDVQGTLKYFATTNANMTAAQAASSNGWVETLPTAAAYTDAYANGLTVYVWYYIQAATGYADSQPQRIEVSLLGNLFNLYLNPADKTSKLDVTVDGTAVTPDNEGKVAEVGMGKTVRINAKRGYVIEQMEVKK